MVKILSYVRWTDRVENVESRKQDLIVDRRKYPRRSVGPSNIFLNSIDVIGDPMFRRAFVRTAKMSTYTTDKASPFTRAVISSMRRLYELDASLSRAGR